MESGIPRFENSLFVWTTVMSRPNAERAWVDVGLKAAFLAPWIPAIPGWRTIPRSRW